MNPRDRFQIIATMSDLDGDQPMCLFSDEVRYDVTCYMK